MTMINKEEAIKVLNALIVDNPSQHSYIDRGINKSIRAISEMDTVKQSTITNPDNYEELFENMIHEVLKVMCVAKGIELNSSIELLVDIRKAVVDYANNWHMDLSTPHKEYSVGDKVSLYYEGIPQQATIVKVNNMDSYGLVLDDCRVVFFRSSDSPTNYIIELQKDINVD